MTTDLTQPPSPADLLATMPFAVRLGITLHEATCARTTGSLPWSPELCTAGGVLHGGALMALADAVGAVCGYLNLPAGSGTSTVESKTNFFRAVRSGALHATATPLHVGGTLIVVQTELQDDDGRPVGQTTQTQIVLAAKLPVQS
ncbi:aromatic compound degradation protein PaaI [Streptomyces viridochromogenes]|uniref:Aromatic compound degradation protein PaaI n=1 Tax=Streptomyces viridochromogenes TaxID=1938 RepID=A0A0J7Z842_STRVR|nr:PaaI family thioesterase [Streptomyces viridochromogenes]KMS72371.1 aromatic compound degradation protein PaaI [Streptomyces viridochromogenes]